MNGFDNLINACDKNIDFYTNHLASLRKLIEFQDVAKKLISEINPNPDFEDFVEMEQFNNHNGYITISLLELSVICKNLCLAKTNWEKAFFIKHGYLTIHETINKLKPGKGVSYVEQTIDAKYPILKDRFHRTLNNIECFKTKNNYKKIEDTRHFIAGHIEKSLKKYYDTIFNLDGEEAAKNISAFLIILNEMLEISKDYSIYANKVQMEKSKDVDTKFNETLAMINHLLNK